MTEKPIDNEKQPEQENEQALPEPSPRFDEEQHGTEEQWVKEKQDNEEVVNAPEKYTPEKVQDYTSITKGEERTWAMLAHLSVLLNLVTGFLGIVAALVIHLSYKERSRFVAYHAMQSFIFQSITWIGAIVIASVNITIGTVLAFLIIPLLCLIPGLLGLLLIPVSLIYGVVGAVQVNNGEDFRYWQIGDWVRGILEQKANK